VNKEITVHTSRTIMFSELSRVMSYILSQHSIENAFIDNVVGKRSKSNQEKTTRYLKQLYGFNLINPSFSAFKWFWQNSNEEDYSVIALIFAIKRDFLLSESIDVVFSKQKGESISIESIEYGIQRIHPNKYSPATLRSASQNIASSWKQAGFILGKTKNIRVQPEIGYWTVTFALLLAFLEGMRGDFLLSSKYIKALGVSDSKLRELISEAAKRDLLQYQNSGNVTTIRFSNLLKTIGINGE
jgi:hypothetical protein